MLVSKELRQRPPKRIGVDRQRPGRWHHVVYIVLFFAVTALAVFTPHWVALVSLGCLVNVILIVGLYQKQRRQRRQILRLLDLLEQRCDTAEAPGRYRHIHDN